MEAPTIHDLVSTLKMTRKQCIEGLKIFLADAIAFEKTKTPDFVRWPDADRLLTFIEMRGFPAPSQHEGWTCLRCKSEVDMTLLRCKCNESPSPWEPILK